MNMDEVRIVCFLLDPWIEETKENLRSFIAKEKISLEIISPS